MYVDGNIQYATTKAGAMSEYLTNNGLSDSII